MKLKESDTNSHLVYLCLPVLTDIEVDKDMDWFDKKIEQENYAAVMILKGVLEQIQKIMVHCFQITYLQQENQRFKDEFMGKFNEELAKKKTDSVTTDGTIEENNEN